MAMEDVRIRSSEAYTGLPTENVDFEVEEQQVMNGLELLYTDKFIEANEYFDTLRPGHARFSFHHAEVASFIALISFDPDDLQFASGLLSDTEALARKQAKRWRTHSKIKKVNEAVTNLKVLALKSVANALKKTGNMGASASAKIMPVETDVEDLDDDDNELETKEEMTTNHRARRMRLWAMLIQAECNLLNPVLQAVAAGESWTAMVKIGYKIKRSWGIYQHCESKLQQLQREWVIIGGSMTGAEELLGDSSHCANETNDMGDRQRRTIASSMLNSNSLVSSSSGGAPSDGEFIYQGARAAEGNLEKLQGGIKEDQELASLRIQWEFGVGAFNLFMSLIPSNYQKAVEVMGIPGDREKGLLLLQKVSAMHHARAPVASILLIQCALPTTT